jgi:cbb3-type cytochrome oxidase cytochrome c subunit
MSYVQSVIAMAQRRLAYLSAQRTAADALGDAEQVARLDDQIAEVEATIAALQALG